ncbi:ABC transporter ATP-binding protein [Heliorestis acidaminivorans]|uniref:ABC transporter ATP-binding protein n=1 Tax=Heliorestis acidaminivorans TaxID=553427 RepID=A0A6I0F6J4_9FIRM|nr:ABC transporter ATP-binding protein [Heliorestis acidaminivorans]KAB2952982.1 ABC transporter ATP-binding protein [Heliorestis acidaminivorans]
MTIVEQDILLEVNKLTWQKEKKRILSIPSLQINQGDHTALIGANGSGKSSLLKILSFLEKPTTGEVSLKTVAERCSVIEKRRKMAVVFQEPLLLNMTVYDNIAYGLKLRGKKKDVAEKVEYWLERLKIGHLKKRHPRNLSGGEAQRVSIARAMALDPQLLFLDEPFSALDAPTKGQLLEDLSAIVKKSKMTTLFVTHDFSEIPFMADKIIVLSEGEVVQQGTVEDIFYRPANSAVAKLVGADNEWSGYVLKKESSAHFIIKLESGKELLVESSAGENGFAEGQGVILFARSEDLALGSAITNNLRGQIKRLSPYGWQYKLTLDCGFPVTVLIDKHSFLQLKPELGNYIDLHIVPRKIHMIKK